MRTVGVEEELLLVDAHRERMTPVATRVLRIATARGDAGDVDVGRGSLAYELQEQQLELYTSPHASMSTLEAELRTLRNLNTRDEYLDALAIAGLAETRHTRT